ncbi:MAG: PilN domain-containing protein [Gammaproteobacteria bacterium]|nr:PilN domain-containing protein [Gammaproteobacteria bacterium]
MNLGAFWAWWQAGLAACLPGSLRRSLTGGQRRLVIEMASEEVLLYQEQAGHVAEEWGRYPRQSLFQRELPVALLKKMRSLPLTLRLPAIQSLQKTIHLPALAETNLRQVVGFEIGRYTPFNASQVYYDAEVLEHQPALRRMQVQLVAVPRATVDILVEELGKIGLTPTSVDVTGNPGLNLLPEEKRSRRGRGLRRLQWSLALLCVGLLCGAVVLPLWEQRMLVINLMPKMDAAQKEAEEVLTLRQDLENVMESSRFLLQKRQDTPLMVGLLRELTRILPDGTWVEYLDIRGNEIQIRGQSTQASALIGLLEASKWLQGVTFRSPITADRRTGKDRFHVAAQIVNPA